MECNKCFSSIDGANPLYIMCEGYCAKRFHATCVNLTEDDISTLSKNIIWICDECLDEFCQMRNKPKSVETQPPKLQEELNDLKIKVSLIMDTIASFAPQASSSKLTDIYSTPIQTPTLLNGSSSDVLVSTMPEEESRETCSIFLYNIDGKVTEGEIGDMVSRSLGFNTTDQAMVTKLVPKWKDCATLDYASFKVTLNKKWKWAALNESMWPWPRKVKCREFIYWKNKTWTPDDHIRNHTLASSNI